ncbi:hypothetical protein F2Q68_00015070 [Brassica cretica]|uniref:Uncharacterized protein n=1 Tax=Brassica cretica TaxID=69181 RepID=A0A8S9HHK5_BRACR|nr:hypothetical protein F2Q68_00015070 [Brassica cretica]
MTCLDDLLVSLPDDLLMMRQLHAVYGEWLLNDGKSKLEDFPDDLIISLPRLPVLCSSFPQSITRQ